MEHFDSDTFEIDGIQFTAEYSYDCDMGYPWEECDGFGIISKAYSRYGRPKKTPGERIIYSEDRTYWIYDVKESIKKARTEGWGCENSEGLTKKQIAARAVEQDIAYIRKWLRQDIFYISVHVYADNDPDNDRYLGGVEYSWGGEYPIECAKELANEIIYDKRKAWRKALKEARARKYWAQRDIVTVGAAA